MSAGESKVVLVTGANTGLGYEIIKALAKTSTTYDIIVGCRRPDSGEAAIEKLKSEVGNTSSRFSVVQIDYESDDSIEKAVQEITSKFGKLDALVNNGGAQFDMAIGKKEMTIREGFNKSWDVNVSGVHVLTYNAVPLLLKSSDPRLLFVTSGTSPLTETELHEGPMFTRLNASPEAGWPKEAQGMGVTTYRSTKTGLNMLMRQWHRILLNDGVKVWSISPGMLATGLGGIGSEALRKMGAEEPYLGGEFVRDVLEGKRDQHVGKAIRRNDVVQPW